MTVSSLQKKQDIIMPLNENKFWNEEVFKINMIVLGVEVVDVQCNNLRAFLTCENILSNLVDLPLKEHKLRKMKLKFADFPSNMRPYMSISIKQHDNRLKNQANNLMKMLVREVVRKSGKELLREHFRKFSLSLSFSLAGEQYQEL
jgi:hypothetical protein